MIGFITNYQSYRKSSFLTRMKIKMENGIGFMDGANPHIILKTLDNPRSSTESAQEEDLRINDSFRSFYTKVVLLFPEQCSFSRCCFFPCTSGYCGTPLIGCLSESLLASFSLVCSLADNLSTSRFYMRLFIEILSYLP